VISARDRAEWDAWLAANHATADEVWVVYWKKASGKPSIAWADAVEVALKYGWIDGIVKSIDEHRYKQRWTPRRPRSKWSQVNKETALRLIAAGEMTPMGLAAVEAAKARGEWDRAYKVPPAKPVPDDLKAALKASPTAKANAQRVSRTRWNSWLDWLDAAAGATRTRRRNLILRALEERDWQLVDEKVRRPGSPGRR
jgi:uncharacterized protein YdeI (YjbR/CyaY-like superfamily)